MQKFFCMQTHANRRNMQSKREKTLKKMNFQLILRFARWRWASFSDLLLWASNGVEIVFWIVFSRNSKSKLLVFVLINALIWLAHAFCSVFTLRSLALSNLLGTSLIPSGVSWWVSQYLGWPGWPSFQNSVGVELIRKTRCDTDRSGDSFIFAILEYFQTW